MSNRIVVTLLSLVWSVLAWAELTPETFVQADIEARQATLEGMVARLSQLQQNADLEDQAQLSEHNQADIDAIFERFGTDSASHAAYGSRHRAAIVAWLEAHPQHQQQYDDLAAQFEALSQQLDVLLGGDGE